MIISIGEKIPKIAQTTFIEESARIIGDVSIEDYSSVWFYCVIRGDVNYIKIGSYTNIQDGVIIHVDEGDYPTIIGDYVTVGHRAVIHGCKIKDNCLIGMASVILNGAKINENSILAAGAVVPPHSEFPPESLIMGVPAKVVRKLTEQDIDMIRRGADNYCRYMKIYKKFYGNKST